MNAIYAHYLPLSVRIVLNYEEKRHCVRQMKLCILSTLGKSENLTNFLYLFDIVLLYLLSTLSRPQHAYNFQGSLLSSN